MHRRSISYSEQSCLHLVKTSASFTTGRDDGDIRFQTMNILGQFRHADPHRFGQINFVDHYQLSSQKHVRVFPYHIRTFGNAHHHDTRLRSKWELGWTNQVTDVLDEDQPQIIELRLSERFADQVRIQMTTIDRGDL